MAGEIWCGDRFTEYLGERAEHLSVEGEAMEGNDAGRADAELTNPEAPVSGCQLVHHEAERPHSLSIR